MSAPLEPTNLKLRASRSSVKVLLGGGGCWGTGQPEPSWQKLTVEPTSGFNIIMVRPPSEVVAVYPPAGPMNTPLGGGAWQRHALEMESKVGLNPPADQLFDRPDG